MSSIPAWLRRVVKSRSGPKILRGVILGQTKKIDPGECSEYIEGNRPLLPPLEDDELQEMKELAAAAHMESITLAEVLAQLAKHNPRTLKVITEHAGGLAWLSTQIDDVNSRLGLAVEEIPLITSQFVEVSAAPLEPPIS